MILDRWVLHGDCLVGYIYDCPSLRSGTRVLTEAVRFIDSTNMEVVCVDGKYKLGEPGTVKEHNQPLIGWKPEAKMPEIDSSIFLNPRG